MNKLAPVKKYVITSYLTFWLMVLGICGCALMVFHASPITMRILSNICAWSPTIVLLLMWKKLRPTQSRKAFFRECFSGKLRIGFLLIPPLIAVGGNLISVWFTSAFTQKDFCSYFSMGSYSLLASILFALFSGPTGEEAGWRGYLRVELNQKYSFLKASIIQGVIWAFWHAVTWLVGPDFEGILMVPYIASNVIVMTCLTIIMNIILEKENNLIYPILIHFSFTFVYCFLQDDIFFYVALAVVYVLIAAAFLLYRKYSKVEHCERK